MTKLNLPRMLPLTALCTTTLLVWVSQMAVHAAEAGLPAIAKAKTNRGVEYGVWGKSSTAKPAPILVVLANTIDGTLGSASFRQSGEFLATDGYLCVSIDLPCHGAQLRAGQRKTLEGWRHLAEREVDFVDETNKRLSEVLDHLIERGVADPARIAVCGTSRGGFLALHFAAHDSRVRCAAAFAPVTDLGALREFKGAEDQPFVRRLALANQSDRLAAKPIWIVIGDQDARVGTSRAIELAAAVKQSARRQNHKSDVDLLVLPESRGHTTPKGASRLAAQWIHRQLTGEEIQDNVAEPLPVRAERTILFVDDHDVLYRAGTRRVFHQAKLHPKNPVIREEKPWEMAIGWTSIHRDVKTGVYQLWYQAYAGGRDKRKSHKCVVCYAESKDGVQFTKPELKIHDFETDRKPWSARFEKTNIVLLGDNGYGDRYANSVLFDPNDVDAARRYKMLYTDFGKAGDGREWPGLFAAFSPDGIRWSKAAQNPLQLTAYGAREMQPPFADKAPYFERWDNRKNFLRKTWPIPMSMSDAIDVCYDPVRSKYVAYGKCWINGPSGGLAWKHAMARVESHDFLNWSEPQIVSAPDEFDPPHTEFHTSPVFYHKGCYFCLNQILVARGETIGAGADQMRVELMISRDGLRWDRPFRGQDFIPNQRQHFSSGAIVTNSTPVILDDEIRFYYGGYSSGAIGGGERLTADSQKSGVGFASIPLDRFAGIRPVAVSDQPTLKRPIENIGQITLKPIDLTGRRELFLNANADKGTVRIELLDRRGYRVQGFTKDDAIPLASDAVHHRVTWKERKLSDLPSGEYHVRVHLDNAEVFTLAIR